MARLLLLCLVIVGLASVVDAFEPGRRLVWKYSETKAVTAGVYGRLRKLNDGSLLLAYSDGPSLWVRRSRDEGLTFSAPVFVAADTGYDDTNAELIQLNNGWLIAGYNCRPNAANQGVLPYQIRTKISRDFGATWESPVIAFGAGKREDVGCWEPVFLQLPSGKVLLFLSNEGAFPSSTEQEIGMMESDDFGRTWTNYHRTSYRAGYRDGMPVPLLLADGKTVVYSIEDNGLLPGNFKPSIISTTLTDLWSSGSVSASSPQRWGALRSDALSASYTAAAAPYLAKFPDGTTLLSVQSGEGRTGYNLTPRVYLGTAEAKDFARGSFPFPWLPPSASGLWNSLTVLDDNNVVLVSSVSGVSSSVGSNALWLSRGVALQPVRAQHRPSALGLPQTAGPWLENPDRTPDLLIAADSGASLQGHVEWDENNLYLGFKVSDSTPVTTGASTDRVEVSLDIQNLNTGAIAAGLKKYVLHSGSSTPDALQGSSSGWVASPGSKATAAMTMQTGGYDSVLTIPWSELGGIPGSGASWGLHVRLADTTAGATRFQDLGDDNPLKPSTWFEASLQNDVQAPSVVIAPLSRTVDEGKAVSLSVKVSGIGPFNYAWAHEGNLLAGATKDTLTLPNVRAADAGTYSVTVSNISGQSITASAEITLAASPFNGLANLSTRALVADGENVLIAGFVVSGTTPRTLLIRGVGPGLSLAFPSLFSSEDVASDPALTIYQGPNAVASNEDWFSQLLGTDLVAYFEAAGAFSLSKGSTDAALLFSAAPGAYTAILRATTGTPLTGLLELYDLDAGGASHLSNLSSRGFVGTGTGLMIPGLVVRGVPRKFLIRGAGPSLAAVFPDLFSKEKVLPDPFLKVLDSSNTNVASNDNWQESDAQLQQAIQQSGAFGFPSGSRDAALVVTLPEGNYTALVSDVATGSGTALVEIYDLGP